MMKQVTHRGITGNSYRSIPICAAKGVHEGAFDILKEALPKEAKILDIAAGVGAFSLRLLDAGYKVAANELDISGWSIPEMTPTQIDLNQPLPSTVESGIFDAVAAIEVIEHLENPRLFLRNCLQLIKPGGFILVTTPNLSARCSRVRFLRQGDFYHFGESAAYKSGHITPIPYWLLKIHAESVGLEVNLVKGLGEYPKLSNNLMMSLKSLLTKLDWKSLGFTITEILAASLIKPTFSADCSSICYAVLLSKPID